MENTNNINIVNLIMMKLKNLKGYIQTLKKALLKLITKDIKILKNINKQIEIKQKEHMKIIKNIL